MNPYHNAKYTHPHKISAKMSLETYPGVAKESPLHDPFASNHSSFLGILASPSIIIHQWHVDPSHFDSSRSVVLLNVVHRLEFHSMCKEPPVQEPIISKFFKSACFLRISINTKTDRTIPISV
jgi:hypothetical protein